MIPRYEFQSFRPLGQDSEAEKTKSFRCKGGDLCSAELPRAQVAFTLQNSRRCDFAVKKQMDGQRKSFLARIAQVCRDPDNPFGDELIFVHQHQPCHA